MRLHEAVTVCDRIYRELNAMSTAVATREGINLGEMLEDLHDVREMIESLEQAVAVLTGVTP